MIYDPDGRIEASGTVGDGIQEVMTTSAGDIWVSYFDEGIFGNYGWGAPGPPPIGACGIIKFGRDLSIAWRYPIDPGDKFIDDCYALNVTDAETWACYYSSFSIIRVAGGTVRRWVNEITGASAILVDDENVALVGGYGEDCNRLVRGVLDAERFVPRSTSRICLPGGEPLPRETRFVGRGSVLHAVHANNWSRLELQ